MLDFTVYQQLPVGVATTRESKARQTLLTLHAEPCRIEIATLPAACLVGK